MLVLSGTDHHGRGMTLLELKQSSPRVRRDSLPGSWPGFSNRRAGSPKTSDKSVGNLGERQRQ